MSDRESRRWIWAWGLVLLGTAALVVFTARGDGKG